jgi:hypothetical protein
VDLTCSRLLPHGTQRNVPLKPRTPGQTIPPILWNRRRFALGDNLPIRRPQWGQKSYHISIAATKDQAEEQHHKAAENNANNSDLLDIYTYGSGIEGHVGAAAYALKTQTERHQYLGSDKMANVFTAELLAIKVAIGILGEHAHFQCSIYADSQAAIKALDKIIPTIRTIYPCRNHNDK